MIAADTNVLVRVIVEDDPKQAALARAELKRAKGVAVSTQALCEFVWVLSKGYGLAAIDIAREVRVLINTAKVAVDRPAVEAGLAVLDQGGDFAYGVIAFEGERLGGSEFISFDKKAVSLLKKRGVSARALG